jgi:hypothetical protein
MVTGSWPVPAPGLLVLVADPNIPGGSPLPARADAIAAPPPAAVPVAAVTVAAPVSVAAPVRAVVSIMMIAAVMAAAVMISTMMAAVVTATAVAAMRHRIRWERQRCRHCGDVS